MIMKVLLLSICVALASSLPSTTPPRFPDTWTASQNSALAIFQGGTKNPDGSVCCSGTAPQCKVQTVTQSGTMVTDGPNNRSRSDTAQGIVVNWYAPLNKQMALQPNPNGEGWVCAAACPLDGEFSDPLAIPSNARDLGPATVGTVKAEHWRFFDTILKLIRMDQKDFLVDQSGADPAPVSLDMKITPFDLPPYLKTHEIGEQNIQYSAFAAHSVDKNAFNILNCTAKHCPCPKPQNGCNQDQNSLGARLLQRAHVMPEPSLVPIKHPGSPSSDLKWSNDWSAQEAAIMVINQGGDKTAEGYCCHPEATAQCQIQLQTGGGMRYVDYSNQRTRLEDMQGKIGVDDYKAKKSLTVVHNGTHDVCESYCPIDPEDTLDPGAAYFLAANATDLGATTFEGKSANEWQWKDKILKIVTMSTTSFFGDVSGTTVAPIAQVEDLTPFGRPLGQSNMTWTSFSPGPQPAAKFAIEGVGNCPKDPNCGSQQNQLRRLLNKQYTSYTKFL